MSEGEKGKMNLRVMGLEGLGVMLRQEESLRFGVGRGWM